MESLEHATAETAREEVVRLLSAAEFVEVAREALGLLSRPQRLALGELLQARARYSELTAPRLMQQGLQDPNEIALALQALHLENPALVTELLGSEFRDLPVMKLTLAALAGVAAKRSVLPPESRRR